MPSATLENEPLLLDIRNTRFRVTSEQFDQLCIDNPDLRMEMTREGDLIVMSPTGGESGSRNFNLYIDLGIWNRQRNLGVAFDSSTGYDFTDFDGGKLSPDVSWIEKSRLVGVDYKGFIPLVPDFVIELRSKSDQLSIVQAKMREYRRLGVRLGLLINPPDKQVEIYRPGQEPVVLDAPMSIDCGDVMPGFVLGLNDIW